MNHHKKPVGRESIIGYIDQNINRLEMAREALGAPPRNGAGVHRRSMSAAARKRISDAQKKRWAGIKRRRPAA